MSYTNGLDKPELYFNTKLYTGNNTTDHAITGVGFKPDWVWIKSRGSTDQHNVYDIVRGATKRLVPNTTASEDTNTETIKSFDSDGFTLGNAGNVNDNFNYVSWNWLASNTTASNTDGSITSTVSTNTTSGFSIVSYTGNATAGATVGHSLGTTPSMVIVKKRNVAGGNWQVYHSSIGNTGAIQLNLTNATGTAIDYWNNTSPTSSVFSLGTGADVNGNTQTFIAYCFAEKKGFSKFGSYTGNGSTDGTFVYTGFKPAMVIRKITSGASDWLIQDNKRSESGGSNMIRNYLFPNSSQAEVSNQNYFNIDFLSNGFKMRSTDGGANGSGQSYIYMCFAENPFVTSTGIPTTAR